jgi:hypothetical protein
MMCVILAVNEPIAITKDVTANGSISEDSIKEEVYKITSASVTYTLEEGQDSSETKSVDVKISEASELNAAFTSATGLNSNRIQSSTLNFEWTLKSDKPVVHKDDVSSSKYWSTYQYESPWQFLEWIKGPPPTETNEGTAAVSTVIAADTKWTTTKQKKTWLLSWKEKKSE